MAPKAEAEPKFVGLPLAVIGPVDIGRLLRELEIIENDLLQQRLKKQEVKLSKTSKMMDELLSINKMSLTAEGETARLKTFLNAIKSRAPVLHMSFSADPSPQFVEKLMDWIRQNLHPLALLTVGLQPNIGAGCILRTDNKHFDFSLGSHFGKDRELLMSKLREDAGPVTTRPATAVEARG